MPIARERSEEFFHHRSCCTLRTKELRPYVIVDPNDIPALTTEYARALRANESSGACNKCFHLLSRLPYLELTPQTGKPLQIKLERCKGTHEGFHRQLFSLSLQ